MRCPKRRLCNGKKICVGALGPYPEERQRLCQTSKLSRRPPRRLLEVEVSRFRGRIAGISPAHFRRWLSEAVQYSGLALIDVRLAWVNNIGPNVQDCLGTRFIILTSPTGERGFVVGRQSPVFRKRSNHSRDSVCCREVSERRVSWL